jgi:hypothetical protein
MIIVVGVIILINAYKSLHLPFDPSQFGLGVALLSLGSMWWDRAKTIARAKGGSPSRLGGK